MNTKMQHTPIELEIEKLEQRGRSNTVAIRPLQFVFGLLLLAIILILSTEHSDAQQYLPERYFKFENANAGHDDMGNGDMDFNRWNSGYTINNNGPVDNYLTMDQTGALISAGMFDPKQYLTVEFLIRPGHDFIGKNIIHRRGGAFEVGFELPSYTSFYPKIRFVTKHKDGGGNTITDGMSVQLDGVGIRSLGHYTDGEFHHIVFIFNGVTGKKQIWVDGQLHPDFEKNIATGAMDGFGQPPELWFNYSIASRKFHGDIDEIALYDKALPPSMVYKHYLEFKAGQHFTWNDDYTGSIPPAQPTTAPLDMMEFPPGHPNVTISAVDQIKSYPTPRYKPDHTLMENFQWFEPQRIAGLQDGYSTPTQIRHEMIRLTKELCGRWNYTLQVSGNTKAHYQYDDTTKVAGAMVKLANQNPQWKTSAISFWAQTKPSDIGYNTSFPHILINSLPANYYLRNSSGQFIGKGGNVTSGRSWSPAAPQNYWQIDGQTQRFYFTQLLSELTRPLDIINENAEVMQLYPSSTLQVDPAVVADKNASGLDWTKYQGWAKARAFHSYSNEFLSLPGLSNTLFTEYGVDGHPVWRHDYSEARKSGSVINGQYYSTPDFYVRWPHNWRNWVGAWHGWQWIAECRHEELKLGDELYSPFVAAGWSNNPEDDVRPSQWLALLKTLGASGAEFYYTGFFSLQAPFPKKENWAWQVVTPSYAQAITSRYEDLLRNGHLMEGDVLANVAVANSNPGYSFHSGDPRKLIVVRKHDQRNEYAIAGSIQPFTNMTGSVEAESDAKIKLNGQDLKFKVRRQGSVYVYDNSNPSDPVFYQLDGWHQYEHPSHWSEDFEFEGELFDNNSSDLVIKTERPANAANGDFTEFTSYVKFENVNNSPVAEYNFSSRDASTDYYLWIRARSSDGTSTGIDVELDNGGVRSIGCIDSTGWVWYRYDACNQQAIQYNAVGRNEHTLKLYPLNDKIEVDKIILTTDASMTLDPAPPNCSATIASISTNGSTTFCAGDSVELTASAGTSYLWLPTGDTTQTITVKNTGTYSVIVGLGTGCSASAPQESVTVISSVAANINASGSTTICTGDSVTLTADPAQSYSWLPNGETTQSITVSTAGSYSVTVVDTNGCSGTSAPVVVSEFTSNGATIAANGPTSICAGDSVVLTAPSGASYLWSNGATSQNIIVTSSGSFSADLTYGSGCTFKTNQIAVNVATPAPASVAANGPLNFCNGSDVTLTASNGNSYLWSPGGQTTQAITVSQGGSYSVQVMDSTGCASESSPTSVIVFPDAVANVSNSGSTSLCPGDNVILTANPSVSYQWSDGSTSQAINVNSAGNYEVTVTDGNGCTAVSAAIPVVVNASPDSTVSSNGSLSFCAGGSVTLSAAPGLVYNWSNGATDQSITVANSGTYNVVVTNLDGCTSASSSRVVDVLPAPSGNINASGSTNICPGVQLTLTAPAGDQYVWSNGDTTSSITVDTAGSFTVQVMNNNGCSHNTNPVVVNVISSNAATIATNGNTAFCQGDSLLLTATAGNSYLWSNGATTQSIYASTAGNYQATVTFNGGCNSVAPAVPITVNTLPTAGITPNGPTNFCQGSSVVLTADPGSSYLWSTGATTQAITVNNAGNYQVTVSNNTGCQRSSNVVPVTVTSVVNAAITASGSTTICQGETVTLSANSGANYVWSNGATTQSITAVASGSYNVTVDYGNGCSDVSPAVNVTVNPLPNVNLSAAGATTFCDGNSVQLNASGGNTYYWFPTGATTNSINVTQSGLYSVVATDNNGCSAISQNLNVNVLPLPSNNVVINGSTSICQGDKVSLIASPGNTYQWSNGTTTQSMTTGNAGTYSVTVTAPNGCDVTSNPITVNVNPNPTVSIHAPTGAAMCQGDSLLLTSNTATNYIWSNGATTQNTFVTLAGPYTVTVANVHGCTAVSAPITVTTSPTPSANVTVNGPTSFCQGDSVILTANQGAYYYWFPNGETTQSITVQDSGTYYVVVSNVGGCSKSSAPINVSVTPTPTATITASGPTTICDGDTVFLAAPAGATYLWSNGATTQNIAATFTGSYAVTVNFGGNCDAVSPPVNVTVRPTPNALVHANGPLTFCDGDQVVLTASNASSYLWSPTGDTTQSITVTQSGAYSVQTSNGNCTNQSTVTTVSVGSAPTPTVTSNVPLVLTPGGSLVLTSSSSAIYSWYPGGQTTQSITVTQPGTYVVTAGLNGQCEANSDSITVVLGSSTFQAYINSLNGNLMCAGDSVQIEASLGSSYYWFHSGETTRSVYVTSAGTYYCVVDDPAGTGPAVASIQMVELPSPMAPGITSTFTPQVGYTLDAYEPSAISYLWSTGETTSSILVTTPGTYTVKAFNAIGCESADKSIVITNVGLQQCATPDMLQAIQIGLTSAELTWNPAITADNFEVSYWELGSTNVTHVTVPGTQHNLLVSNLNSATVYEWSVKSICITGLKISATSDFLTLGGPLPCGSTPQNLQNDSITKYSAYCLWHPTAADQFIVNYKKVADANYTTLLIPGNVIDNFKLELLDEGTTYQWNITSVCAGITSLPSADRYFTTLMDPECDGPKNLFIDFVKPESAQISWGLNYFVDSIKVFVREAGTMNIQTIFLPGNPVAAQVLLENLKPETTYHIWVRSICSFGKSNISDIISIKTGAIPGYYLSGDIKDPLQLNLYPVPTFDILNYAFNSPDRSPYDIILFDCKGKTLYTRSGTSIIGENKGSVNVQNLRSGAYTLQIYHNGWHTEKRFMKF